MTPEDLIKNACPKIGSLGSAFYFIPETVSRGKEHGLDGFRFYFLGRGGVLGDVEAKVIQSAFGYFHPALVDKIWNSAREKMAPREAARLYLECCADLGRRKLADAEGLDAFCAAAEKVVAAADPAALALFAGIAAEPLPEDVPGRAMQLVAVLREYRGSAHLVAVVASGLSPAVAHYIKRPDDYATFGYGDGSPAITDAERAALEAAERLTDAIVLSGYSALDAGEAAALFAGVETIERALAS
jgi:hypothetical protein